MRLSNSRSSQRSAARILCRGAGYAVVLSRPPATCRGDGAPSGATILPALRRARALRSARSPLGAPRAAISVPGAVTSRRGTGRSSRPGSGRLPPPFVPATSSHSRRPVLVPADGWPGPPGDKARPLPAGAASRSAFRIVSRRRPSKSRIGRIIVGIITLTKQRPTNSSASFPGTGTGAPVIPTAEMIAAGAEALSRFAGGSVSSFGIVETVYTTMIREASLNSRDQAERSSGMLGAGHE